MTTASRRVLVSMGLSACFLAQARAADAIELPTAAAPTPASPAAASASPVERRQHPPVSMAGFSRRYRAIPLQRTDADEAIHAVLTKPIDPSLKLRGTSLRAALSLIQDVHCVAVVIDTQSLADAGIDLEGSTLEQEAAGASLGAALRLVLRPIGLTWLVRDGVLMVTTTDKAQEQLSVVAYPVPRAVGTHRPPDLQDVIDLVQSTVAAPTWDTVGGQGAIRPILRDGVALLIVSQTSEVHEEIENLLRVIHERMLAEFATGQPVLRVHHVADAAARASLADSLTRVCNAALAEAGDAQASVTTIGDAVAVLSKSAEFHVLAAQVIAAVAGLDAERHGPGGPGKPFGH